VLTDEGECAILTVSKRANPEETPSVWKSRQRFGAEAGSADRENSGTGNTPLSGDNYIKKPGASASMQGGTAGAIPSLKNIVVFEVFSFLGG
jgi:hypothetical protein